jgi:small subunit ribosomal protein S21
MNSIRQFKNVNNNEVFSKHLEITVNNGNFDDAFRKFKTAVQAEGIIADYKAKQAYEKPSERKRRKTREAEERRLLMASREVLIASGEWEKRQKRKEQKRQDKAELRRKQASE